MKDLFPPAQLARCHRSGEYIYFRIGKAQDINAILEALKEQIPSSAYRHDSFSQEWRVDARYHSVLYALFTNFPTILRSQSGVNLPSHNSPYNGPKYRPYTSGLARTRDSINANRVNLLAWIAIALICIALWPWLDDMSQSPSLAIRIIEPTAIQTESATAATTLQRSSSQPTAPAESLQPAPAANATVFQTANLRTGPGTNYATQGQADVGQSLLLTGQVSIPGDYSWYRIDNGLWIYSLLVSEPSEDLPIIDAGDNR